MDISRSILDQCYAHGIQTYPQEACGLITQLGDLQEFHPTRNVMDELHALDKQKYPRTSLTGYYVDPIEMIRLYNSGYELKILYHTHPDREAYFSDTDKALAIVAGMPTSPGYLVCGIKDRKPNGAILAVFNQGDFDITRIE